eukprot:4318561-Pyramimonas_sp.AAC.1
MPNLPPVARVAADSRAAEPPPPSHIPVPPPIGQHFYSILIGVGPRRPSDLQAAVDRSAEEEGLRIIVLNLAAEQDSTMERPEVTTLVELILSGRVWAVISGPPCETF